VYRLAYNGDVVAFKMGRRLVKRVGGSAFAKHHQLRRDLLIVVAVSKSGLTSPDADTPIRRPADTLPQPATVPPTPSKNRLGGSGSITSRSLSLRRELLLLQPLLLDSSAVRWFRANGED
jgi:hypothetical protein